MKKTILILVAFGALALCVFFLLFPPYPNLWDRVTFGMERAEIEKLAKQADGIQLAKDGKMGTWELKRGLGRFVIQITFLDEKAEHLHCEYQSDVAPIFRARNKQR